nr:YdcF family protein [Eubacterium multiforme]
MICEGCELLNIIIFILGIICIAYFLFVNMIFGYTTFSSFYLVIGIIMILYGIFITKLLKIEAFKRIFKPLKLLLLCGILIFIITELCIIFYPKTSEKSCNYIVVLGAGIRGENLTTTLRDRLNATLDYINNTNYDGKIIVSGGQGPGESITEAEAMRRYLVEKGINNNRIILEDKATNTFQNFKYSKDIIENLNEGNTKNSNIKVVTTDFHALRSNIIGKRNGYENISFYTSNTKWYLVPSMYAREFFAVFKSIVFDR